MIRFNWDIVNWKMEKISNEIMNLHEPTQRPKHGFSPVNGPRLWFERKICRVLTWWCNNDGIYKKWTILTLTTMSLWRWILPLIPFPRSKNWFDLKIWVNLVFSNTATIASKTYTVSDKKTIFIFHVSKFWSWLQNNHTWQKLLSIRVHFS